MLLLVVWKGIYGLKMKIAKILDYSFLYLRHIKNWKVVEKLQVQKMEEKIGKDNID